MKKKKTGAKRKKKGLAKKRGLAVNKRRGARKNSKREKKEKPRFLFFKERTCAKKEKKYLFLCGEFYVKNKVKKGWREDDKNNRGGV